MDITLTINYGPLNAEFQGENQEELQNELIEFIDFIEENEDAFGGSDFSIEQGDENGNPGLDADYWEDRQDTPDETTNDGEDNSGTTFGSIPNRTDSNEATLNTYFGIDPEGEEPPYLNFDVEALGESGTSRSEKQMRGSLILLTLWRECNDVEEARSPELKDALRISGIDDTNLSNMYQFNDGEGDRYFRREGSGANTDISLTMPGEREGYDQIQRTLERLEGDWEADE